MLLTILLTSCSEERETDTLLERNGLKYAINEEKPFTGKHVTYWPSSFKSDGKESKSVKESKAKSIDTTVSIIRQKLTEMNYKNGKQDGLSIGWHKNGQISRKGSFKKGKRDGFLTDWYNNELRFNS